MFVRILIQRIKTINIFRDPRLLFFRKASFEALTVNKSEKCERELIKLTKSFRPDIKNKSIETLQKRREYIFGEDEND